jgi:hypothetical protein
MKSGDVEKVKKFMQEAAGKRTETDECEEFFDACLLATKCTSIFMQLFGVEMWGKSDKKLGYINLGDQNCKLELIKTLGLESRALEDFGFFLDFVFDIDSWIPESF